MLQPVGSIHSQINRQKRRAVEKGIAMNKRHEHMNSTYIAALLVFVAASIMTGCNSQNAPDHVSTTTLSTEPLSESTTSTSELLTSEISDLEREALALESENRLAEAASVREELHGVISSNTPADSWQAKTAQEIASAARRKSELTPENIALLDNAKQLLETLQNQISSRKTKLARNTAEHIISIYERVYGIESLPVAQVLVQVANQEYKSADNTGDAITHFHRAIESFKKLDLNDHPQLEEAYMGLGALYVRKKKFKPAISNQKAAARIALKVWGENSINYADQANQLGVMMHASGQAQDALQVLLAAAAIRSKVLGPADPKVAHSLFNVATVQQDLKQFDEAIQSYVKARASFMASKSLDAAPYIDKCNTNLATILMLQNRLADAEKLLAGLLESAESNKSSPAHVALCKYRFSIALARQGKYEQAQPLMEQAIQSQQQNLGIQHPETIKTMQAYALLLKTTNQTAEAEHISGVIKQVSFEEESNDFQAK